MSVSLEALLERQHDLPELNLSTLSGIPSGLLQALETAEDPRRKQGQRYPKAWLLAIMVCTIMRQMTSYRQMSRLAARLPGRGTKTVPDPSTFHRLLTAINPDSLQHALTSWVAQQTNTSTSSWLAEAISIDRKEACSAKHGGNPRVHLLSACIHNTGLVLGQVDVGAKTNEITALPELLQSLAKEHDLSNRVITLDALYTQRETAKLITETYGAHYVFTLKGNQLSLRHQVKDLLWSDVPVSDTTIDTSRGRVMIRNLQVATIKDRVLSDWPGLKQVGRLTRERTINTVTSTEVVYILTSLPQFLAGPGYLADVIRRHWTVKNNVHYVRDVTFKEDKNQVRTGFAPRNLAALTNAVITAFRLAGLEKIREATVELLASHQLIRRVLESV